MPTTRPSLDHGQRANLVFEHDRRRLDDLVIGRDAQDGRGHDGGHRHRLVLTSAPSLQGYVLVGLSLGAREGGRDLAHLAREASQKVVKAQHPH